MTVGERIKHLRKDVLNLTQQDFAKRITVKRNTVATYEMGRSNPSDSALSLICREFNVRREWLEKGTGEIFNPESSGLLDELAVEYHLNEFDQALVQEYLKLSAEHRNVFKEYLQRVLTQTTAADEQSEDGEDLEAIISSIPDTPEELEKMYPTFDVPPDLDKMG